MNRPADSTALRRAPLRSVLGDQVKEHLLKDILAGKYPPGARIVETQVAREMGVSQSPVREALRDLAALGVIEVSAFRGARVRRPTTQELLDAFAVRAQLEALAARLACARMSDPDLAALSRFIDDMQAAEREGDAHAQATADAGFHEAIVTLSGNSVLQRAWRTTEPLLRTYLTIVTRGSGEPIAERHRMLFDALRSRDEKRVTRAIVLHFDEAAAKMARLWNDGEPAAPAQGSAGRALPARPRRTAKPRRA